MIAGWRHIRDQRGFSMLEMMIVLVLIGLMASLAIPSWLEQMPRLETQSDVRAIVSKLREARSLAIARKEPAGLSFNGGNGTWTVFLDNNPMDNQHSAGDSAMVTGSIGSRVSVSYNGFSNQDVIFNSDGSAIQSGAVCLDAEDNSIVYTIDVLASTGRVRMVEGFYPYGQN